MPEEEIRVAELKTFETKSGSRYFVLVDDQGREYSTFEEQVAAKLPGLEGKRVRIIYHLEEREGFTNRHLDDIELRTGEQELSPRDLFAKLQPFKTLVAEDLEKNGDG